MPSTIGIALDEAAAALRQVADEARQVFMARSGTDLVEKALQKYVTQADLEIERLARNALGDRTPSIPVLGEEEAGAEKDETTFWVVDPIDGTVNHAHRLPLCGVAVSLVHRGTSVAALVDLPVLDERYEARSGRGATMNGKPISVSATDELDRAVVGCGDFSSGEGARAKNRFRLSVLENLCDRVLHVRMHGSAAVDLAWTAAGRLDANVVFSNKPWDVQAGVLLVREAGGQVVDQDGSTHDLFSQRTIAANGRLPPLVGQFAASPNSSTF
jgi:myo-inositol-1(or 4)-monophosphatase